MRVLEPLALDRRVTEVLMEGGGALPVYRCDTPAACLNPSLGTVTGREVERGVSVATAGAGGRASASGAELASSMGSLRAGRDRHGARVLPRRLAGLPPAGWPS